MIEKEKHLRFLQLEEMKMTQLYVRTSQRYLKRTSCGCYSCFIQWYHTCLIPSHYDQKVTIALLHGAFLSVKKLAATSKEYHELDQDVGSTEKAEIPDHGFEEKNEPSIEK